MSNKAVLIILALGIVALSLMPYALLLFGPLVVNTSVQVTSTDLTAAIDNTFMGMVVLVFTAWALKD